MTHLLELNSLYDFDHHTRDSQHPHSTGRVTRHNAMVSVASLLNPVPPLFEDYRDLRSPASTTYTSGFSSPALHQLKKQKMSKDAAIFAKGKIKGETRYPPYEILNNELAMQYRTFQLFPENPQQIVEYPRHIPYNSEKKSFLEKTGRESFEGNGNLFNAEDSKRLIELMSAQFSNIPSKFLAMTATTR